MSFYKSDQFVNYILELLFQIMLIPLPFFQGIIY